MIAAIVRFKILIELISFAIEVTKFKFLYKKLLCLVVCKNSLEILSSHKPNINPCNGINELPAWYIYVLITQDHNHGHEYDV